MKYFLYCMFASVALFVYLPAICQVTNTKVAKRNAVKLFDGKTFTGWDGDIGNTWHIEDGAIAGGSLEVPVAHNFFLTTTKPYSNFILKLQFKLVCKEGFMNAGVQFRSTKMNDPSYEMVGYQADLGPGYWASLYDESRRNKTLASTDSLLIAKLLKPDEWNDYEVRAVDNHIEILLNGVQTVDYTEADNTIPQQGLIGLQIHGGGKTKVWYKNIFITEMR
ncbi:MAG TPA: DUF1080 domain-containing protein [Panacibacter sp.]|nr:DUF1080 domain-containing protein [Panacibacter sp.]